MKKIYLNEETAKRVLEALGIQAEQPKLAPKLSDPPVVIFIEAINIYPDRADADYDEDEDEDSCDCDEDAEETCLNFEADKTGRCIHSCPECGKCMLED